MPDNSSGVGKTIQSGDARSRRLPEEVARLREQMHALKDWFHQIDLGDGLVTPGRRGQRLWRANRQLMDRVDFRGKTVLDIGSCDGMFSFEAERRGASYVAATDLGSSAHSMIRSQRRRIEFHRLFMDRAPSHGCAAGRSSPDRTSCA